MTIRTATGLIASYMRSCGVAHILNISWSELNISMLVINIGVGMSISNSYSMRFVKYAGSLYQVRT